MERDAYSFHCRVSLSATLNTALIVHTSLTCLFILAIFCIAHSHHPYMYTAMGGSRKATTTHSAATSTTLGKAELVQQLSSPADFCPRLYVARQQAPNLCTYQIGIRHGSALRGSTLRTQRC